MEKLKAMLDILPFFLQVGQSKKLNYTRMIEAVVIAAVIGGMSWATFNTKLVNMEAGLADLKHSIREVNQRVDRIYEKVK